MSLISRVSSEDAFQYVCNGSTPIIENSEPKFRIGPEAEIQTETLPKNPR
jgi:hypothetical protein